MLGVPGQILLKKGVDLNKEGPLIHRYVETFTTWQFLLGLTLFVCSLFFWIRVLQKAPLSYIHPMVSIQYALIVISSHIFLRESIPFVRWVGVIVICLGVYIVLISSKGE